MILSRVIRSGQRSAPENAAQPTNPQPASFSRFSRGSQRTKAGQTVTPESSKSVATAYRAANIISDGIAKMPLQLFRQVTDEEGLSGSKKQRVRPDARTRNTPYLLEISPNLWGWTPFQFKKAGAQWLIFYGNSYIWSPPVWPFQKYVLPADTTYPVFDEDGDLWYATLLTKTGQVEYLPGPEVMHTLINPDDSGHVGRGVVEYARETLGRQLGAFEAESKLFGDGLTPAAIMQVNATLDKQGRDEYRKSYGEVMSGDKDGVRLAVLDNRITKFEPVTMKLVDAQFLELISATDRDIANFFGMPLHMLNMGKQSYNSNEHKYLEYLNETLDPYLVQIEQGARIKWLSIDQQNDYFFKFNRDAQLRMDGKTRAEMNEILIRSGQRSPNEAREKDDYSAYPDGEKFYMTKNYASIEQIGADSDGQ